MIKNKIKKLEEEIKELINSNMMIAPIVMKKCKEIAILKEFLEKESSK